MLMISKTVQGNKHNRTVVSRRIRRARRARAIGLPALYIMLVCRIEKRSGYQEETVTYPLSKDVPRDSPPSRAHL